MHFEHAMMLGRELYGATFAKTKNFDDALRGVVDWCDLHRARRPALSRFVETALAEPCGPAHVLWAARWAGAGFPQVSVGHKLAASLLATRIDPDAGGGIVQPWPAYLVLVPDGLLEVPDGLCPGKLMSVDFLSVFDAGRFVHITASSRSSEFTFSVAHRTLAGGLDDGLERNEDGSPFGVPVPPAVAASDVHKRVLGLLWRLMLGASLEMSDASRVRAPLKSPRPARDLRASAAPAALTYVLCRDVVVDCRSAVHDYVFGRRQGSPTVQVLVRGHWKRQVFGAKQGSRRWIHVEPYWRGPEDAPVPIRTHRVGDRT